MLKRLLTAFCCLFPMLLLAQTATENELIIKTTRKYSLNRFGTGLSQLDSFLQSKSLKNLQTLAQQPESNYFIVSFNDSIDFQEIENLNLPGVEYIQPNYMNEFLVTPDDPYFYAQYMDIVQAPLAWNVTTGSKNILVAVVDSGIHLDHEDLQHNIYVNHAEIPENLFADIDENADNRISNIEIIAFFTDNNYDFNGDMNIDHKDVFHEMSPLINGLDDDENGYTDDLMGWDFTDAAELANIASGDYLIQDNYPEDEYNHGTHVAGIIGATANNNTGIAGLCWNVELLPIRAGFKTADGLSGVLQDDDASAGIIYAADQGADVINLSWGDYVYSPIIADACEYAYQQGCIVVVSAGNTASEGLMYPARLAHTISVGAVDGQKERFWQSSYGYQLDLMAPGVSVMSCFDIDETLYEQMSGTSMSAPFVSGAIALLLAVEPQHDFASVRSRLIDSALDLGEQGHDPYYGFGLLDTAALLQTQHLPYIEITYPPDNFGLSQSFPVTGTVNAQDFARYALMFSTTLQPDETDWRSVESPHSMNPQWHMEQVTDGELAWFDIPAVDGDVLVKLELVTNSNEHYNYPFTIRLDQSPPQLKMEQTVMQYRYEGENLVNYLQLVFNETVDVKAELSSDSNSDITIYSSSRDSIHYLRLPLLVNAGEYSAQITAENISGLSAQFQIESGLAVKLQCLDYSSWQIEDSSSSLIFLDRPLALDFDQNINDLIGMHVDEDLQRQISAWEADGSGISHKYTITGFAENFWLHDWGNLSDDNFEIIGVEANTSVLYQINGSSADRIWSLSNSYGGSFIDYNSDGIDDLGIIQNVTIGNVTYRVLSLNKKFGNSWQTQFLVYNNTETFSKNEFLNKVKAADFDHDGFNEILTADNDGDIIIYKYEEAQMGFVQTWTKRMPLQNADYITTGNFCGSEYKEFCVGVWNYNEKNAANTFSWFEIFGWDESLQQYTSLDTLIFDEYRENNALTACDVDNDGYDEIILAADPSLYIIDYVDTDGDELPDSFLAVWKGNSSQHYPHTIAAVPANNQQNGQIFTNQIIGEEYRLISYYPAQLNGRPDPVNGFQAEVIASGSVQLTWLLDEDARFYELFRKNEDEAGSSEDLICQTEELSFIDENLPLETNWAYRIRASNPDFDPQTSLPSYWKNVYTAEPLQLASDIKMISPWNLEIIFDQPLANDAVYTGHYLVNNNIGRPASVNHINQKKGVLLTFHQQLEQKDNYIVTITNLASEYGVKIPETDFDFFWQEDIFPPQIVQCSVINRKKIALIFTEPLQSAEALDKNNYLIQLPEIDKNNFLQSVHLNENEVLLEFAEELSYTNQPSYIRVENLKDLCGNKINSLGNKTYFTLTNSSLKNMVTYPNPFYTGEYEEFFFAALPLHLEGKIWIYDLTGEVVFYSPISPRSVLQNYFTWNGKNNAGKKVSSGMYLYLLKMGSEMQRGKMAVIN